VKVLFPILDLHKGENKFIGIMYISSLLKKAGHVVEVVNADYTEVKKRIEKKAFPVIAYSTPTAYAPYYLELNRRIKQEFSVLSVFGGPHPTYYPEMIDEEGVDGVCVGEGEYPMLELVDHLEHGMPVENIENWWIKKQGHVYRNPLRPLIQNLDELPLPDREIYEKEIPHNNWMTYVMAGRGCPYGCTYCFNHAYRDLYEGKGRYVRRRGVDNVMAELKEIKSRRCYKFIRFFDDIFPLSSEWIQEFAEKYEEIGIPFSCFARADLVNAAMIKVLKKAGCRTIFIGVEAGNDAVRNQVMKRRMTRDQIVGASRLIVENGIHLVTGSMLGIPGTSFEADLETVKLNIECRPSWASVTLLQPYHKTEIHEYALGLGLIAKDDLEMNERSVAKISSLRYKDRKQKRHVENLQKFFGIAVQFPVLLPVVRTLVKLPQNRLFDFIYGRWSDYCRFFKVFPPAMGIANLWKREKLYRTIYDLFRKAQGTQP
jgi:anaerobic magnesium-protoporphyrin IX monomethyl ester cyclase